MEVLHCREPTYLAAASCSDKPYFEVGWNNALNESRDVQLAKAQADKAFWYCLSVQRHVISVEEQDVAWFVNNCCWQSR